MEVALQTHNYLIRNLIDEFGGYEVKTEGDAFMVAFSSPSAAVKFAIRVQLELLNADWAEEVFQHEDSAIEYDKDGTLIFRGYRVRIGIHSGQPRCEPDPITGRIDYFGPMGMSNYIHNSSLNKHI